MVMQLESVLMVEFFQLILGILYGVKGILLGLLIIIVGLKASLTNAKHVPHQPSH